MALFASLQMGFYTSPAVLHFAEFSCLGIGWCKYNEAFNFQNLLIMPSTQMRMFLKSLVLLNFTTRIILIIKLISLILEIKPEID